jgi:hypothetical protein
VCADIVSGTDGRRAMLGEGEGLELIAVFVTVMVTLAIMTVLGKWWEA